MHPPLPEHYSYVTFQWIKAVYEVFYEFWKEIWQLRSAWALLQGVRIVTGHKCPSQ